MRGLPVALTALVVVCGLSVPLAGQASEPPLCSAECGRLFSAPKPTKPTCRKSVTRKVLQGGAFRSKTTPVQACIDKFAAYEPALKAWMALDGERAPFGDQARCLSMCGELIAMRGGVPVPKEVNRISDALQGAVLTPAQLASPLVETLGVNTKGKSLAIKMVPEGAEVTIGTETAEKQSMTSEGRLFIDFRHRYPREVRAKLQTPDGAEVDLKFVKGARTSRRDIRFEYAYSMSAPKVANGTWTLTVSDVSRGASGQLGPWTIESIGPDPFKMTQGDFDEPVEIPDQSSNTTTQTFKPMRSYNSGSIPFTATFPGHEIYSGTVELPVGGSVVHTARMKPITGKLAVDPNGARIINLSAVDIPALAMEPQDTQFDFEGAKAMRREVAGPPATWDNLIVGEYTMTVSHPCYPPQFENVTIRAGETTKARFAKGGRHTLKIEVEPPGASVSLNGHRAGDAPLVCENMGPGDVGIVVSKSGHETAEDEVTLGAEDAVSRRFLLWRSPPDNERNLQWEKTQLLGAFIGFFWMPKWNVERRQLLIAGGPFSYTRVDGNLAGGGFEAQAGDALRVFGHIAGPVFYFSNEMPDFLEPVRAEQLGLGFGFELGARLRLSKREWGSRFPLEAKLRYDYLNLARERLKPSGEPGVPGEVVRRSLRTLEPSFRWYFAYSPRHYVAPSSHLVWLTGDWDTLDGRMADIDEWRHYAGVHLGGTMGHYSYRSYDWLWRFDYHVYFETDTSDGNVFENNIMGGGMTVSITED